ncbi:Gfo/Idh/MocA family oxidoreductase [Kribbella sandramycini]|uniref:Gfo/Idh/MocA family oxidoreductase n=1 Tax=Kribbella sandramycini TaxID=60450 RepID=A0A7Y4P2V1_9ACTN|nr:Gfo/Idh/MocA family oxidoreductase [Kribbella sandramycini]MBB6571132.1 putative dehydrogenase [Kribbella sandramycini]NOL43460.1 Gfo/Idh/MocA family oxidoreductase [Kribbella sandramycini]
MPLEIGLIGATGIAARTMLGPADAVNAHVRAVAASDPVRAKEYANQHRIEVVHDNYAALLADPQIDAVYVSLHNSAHHRWAVRAAVAGKHVIVEKPLCLTADEVAELEFAADGAVHVTEAVATAHHEWQQVVRSFIVDGRYGVLRSVHTRMTFAEPEPGGYRDRPELGGGIFFDCASYWLQALQATVGLEVTEYAGESTFDGPNGVDREFLATLRWPETTATLECGVGPNHVSEHVFEFEGATVKLRNFLRPVIAALPLNLVVTPAGGDREVIGFAPVSYYESQLARLVDGRSDLADAVPRIELMDAIYQSARKAAE